MTDIAPSDLRSEERNAYRAATDTGLWDILISSVVALFAVAPLLSSKLGDFWSSAVFIPVWVVVYVGVRFVKDRFVTPRIGEVRWGPARKSRLKKLGVAMLVVNIVALGLGALAYLATEWGYSDLWVMPVPFGLVVLVLFSLLAYAVSIPRFFFYGLLLAVSPLIGELLFRQGLATHHGFPVVFGIVAVAIAFLGLIRLGRILKMRPESSV